MADQTIYEYVAQAGDSIRRASIPADNERMVRAILREQGMIPLEIKRSKAKTAEEGTESAKKLTFFYVAIPTSGGDNVQGEIIASSEREARQQLRDRGLIPSKVEPKKLWHDLAMAGKVETVQSLRDRALAETRANNSLSGKIQRLMRKKIGLKDMLFYASQLCTMTEAGLSFSQSMDILSGLITNPRLKVIHEVVKMQVMEGASLSESYRLFESELPPIFMELISVGEVSGNIEQTLTRLVGHLEKQMELAGKIRGAMTYPIVMMALIILIVIGLMVFVVPTFLQLFESFNVQLPWTTKTLLGMSWFVTNRWYMLPLIPLAIWGSIKGFMSTKFGRQFYDLWEYRIPIVGKLIHRITVSRILHNLALFLNCGITILNAIELTQQSIRNAYTSLKMESIRVGISQGSRLSSLFEGTGLFPPMVNYLLVAGEESGAIDELLEKGAKYVDQEVEASIKALTSALEPLLTFVIAGVVMFVVGSLYMPLMGLMKGGNHGVQ